MPQFRQGDSTRDRQTAKYRNWDGVSGGQDQPSPFKDLVQRDPVVCDHCFLYRYDTLTTEWWRGDPELGWMDYETWDAIPGRSDPVPADKSAHGLRLACGNCGYRNAKHRPVPKEDVFEFAENIVDVLERKQIDIDPEVLLHEVDVRVEEPENQGKLDSDVFGPAVREAIRR